MLADDLRTVSTFEQVLLMVCTAITQHGYERESTLTVVLNSLMETDENEETFKIYTQRSDWSLHHTPIGCSDIIKDLPITADVLFIE